MILIGIAETMPALARRHRPAFSFVNVIRLPDIEEPAVGFIFKALNLFAKMQGALNGAVDQALTGITAQHRRCSFNRGHQRIAGRGGGVHHKGFVEGIFIVLALNVDQRGLRKRSQHFVRGLGFEEHFTRQAFSAHPALSGIDRMEIGIGDPGRIKMDGRHIEILFHPVGVVQQTIVGGIGDHRVNRPACARHGCHFALYCRMRKFPARDPAQNAQRVAGR